MGVPFLDSFDLGGDLERFLAEQAQRTGLPPEAISGSLTSSRGIPNTRTRLSHAYRLQTERGQTIGAVFRSEVVQSRNVKFVYENDVNANGQPADIIPGVMTEQAFSIARYDLYEKILEEVFDDFELEMLTDQSRGWRIREIWRAPTNLLNSRGRRYDYGPAYFSRLGRQVDAGDDRIVHVNAELRWLRRRKISG